jgi:hypothetical protein
MAWTGSPINVKREVLIGFDLLLAVVVLVTKAGSRSRDTPVSTAYLCLCGQTAAQVVGPN